MHFCSGGPKSSAAPTTSFFTFSQKRNGRLGSAAGAAREFSWFLGLSSKAAQHTLFFGFSQKWNMLRDTEKADLGRLTSSELSCLYDESDRALWIASLFEFFGPEEVDRFLYLETSVPKKCAILPF